MKDYVGCFTYIKNWTVAHGHYPSSSKDAETIFEDILKLRVNYTVVDVENQQVDFAKPSGKYVSILQKETEKAREASANKYFKFDEEDGVKTFNKRDYLSDIPAVKFYAICKEYGLTGYRKLSRWSVISTLMKHPDIDHIIYRLLQEDRHYKITEEDLIAIAALRKILCKKKSNQTLPVNRADQGILLLIALFPEWERGMRASA